MAPTMTQQHHHRSTTKADHKAFKSKHATKSALKDRAKGKIEKDDRSKRHTPHQQVMSKLDRRNKAKQLRVNHKERQDHESTIFQGIDGAAKHVAVVALSGDIDVRAAINLLNAAVDVSPAVQEQESTVVRVRIDRFKRNLLYLPTSSGLVDSLDTCKMADWVLFLITAEQEFGEEQDVLLRALEGQGITNVVVAVTDLEAKVSAGKRSRCLADLKAAFGRYFADTDKISILESKSDCANLVRSLCSASTRGIRWRDDRSWMHIDAVVWSDNPDTPTPTISGTIRGKPLNPDRLVHVPGWGEYRISRVVEIPAQNQKRKANEMMSEDPKQYTPTDAQDDLDELAPEVTEMIDATSTVATSDHKGVLLDDHHYFSDDNSHVPSQPHKLPKGTSNYQAAWYLDDISDSDSDMLDDEEGDEVTMDGLDLGPEDGAVVDRADAMTDVAGTEYPESEMHEDADADEEARQLQEFRASRKQEADEDLEFPDEIELSPNVLARERLAKYRGLKSLRTSDWNTEEDKSFEPLEYRRLLQIPEYKKSYSAALKEAMIGAIPVGTKVDIQLEALPSSLRANPSPTAMFSLLKHEHKHAVINLNMTLSSYVEDPIRSKEELIVQIGHRRLVINPVFSASGQTPNDVHKFDRYLHPGRSAIATFTGPLTWGSVPVLVFRRTKKATNGHIDDAEQAPDLMDASKPTSTNQDSLELIGTATTVPPSSARVIAKRIILTGHPYKIHKKLVTIRYMFFNREDVTWFSALPLWTKRGRQGWIKEPLGTHGYFKATFDGAGKVNAMDAVGVSLYKRVWPRPAKRLEF